MPFNNASSLSFLIKVSAQEGTLQRYIVAALKRLQAANQLG